SSHVPDTVLFNQVPYRGAAHTSDLYYLFEGTNTFENAGNTFTPFNTVRQTPYPLEVAYIADLRAKPFSPKEAIPYSTSFAATGNPSTDKESISPSWDSFITPDLLRRRLMLTRGSNTATNSTMETITEVEMQRCQWM
ncbi:hypothetical protein B0H19DRAFT_1130021, partial [Mycena capillaripes]